MRQRELRHFFIQKHPSGGDRMRELSVELSAESDRPLYEQIYEGIKKEIIRGNLKEGERLPSTRYFAGYLEVSRSTVELAYDQLVSEGYILSEACRGYFVCDIGETCDLEESDAEKKTERMQEKTKDTVKKRQEYRYDLSPDSVDLSYFPFKEWSNITRELLLDQGDRLLMRTEIPQEMKI